MALDQTPRGEASGMMMVSQVVVWEWRWFGGLAEVGHLLGAYRGRLTTGSSLQRAMVSDVM